jgi:hypothetical protein
MVTLVARADWATSTASPNGAIVTSWLVTKPILGWEEAKLQQ